MTEQIESLKVALAEEAALDARKKLVRRIQLLEWQLDATGHAGTEQRGRKCVPSQTIGGEPCSYATQREADYWENH